MTLYKYLRKSTFPVITFFVRFARIDVKSNEYFELLILDRWFWHTLVNSAMDGKVESWYQSIYDLEKL